VPAHFCGIVGLKPTWGTIPGSGHMAPSVAAPPPIAHMATIGPMARYVDDLTLAYNVVKGQHSSTPYSVPTPEAHPEKIDLKKIRCAIFTDACNVPVSSDIRAAIERAGRELQKMGIVVEAVKPPIDDGERLWWEYNGADGNQTMVAALGEALKLSRDRLRSFAVAGEGKSAADFFKIAMERDAWRVQLAEFMERYPIILGPTFCVTAFKHGATEVDIDGKKYPHFLAGWPVAWGNCAGLPGAVVPCGKDREGLPIGLQISGRAFGEETVLAVAKAAESALGGYQKPPM
jgi:amidase